jgi:hypothetical protein
MKHPGLRLEQAVIPADRINRKRSDLEETAALDAGFPIKVTGMEVDLEVEHLFAMKEELLWIEGSEPYGIAAAIFPYQAPVVMPARLGGAARRGSQENR